VFKNPQLTAAIITGTSAKTTRLHEDRNMIRYSLVRPAASAAFVLLGALTAVACSGAITDVNVLPPPAQEFGFGPRSSADATYTVWVQPLQTIRIGQLHAWRLEVRDRQGNGVAGAEITVDGGMPQHGHGLPTRPKVTKELGGGVYEAEGMRFNMGGWWVVKFRIRSAAGDDTVTFNIRLRPCSDSRSPGQ
jgi:hypothetical protein